MVQKITSYTSNFPLQRNFEPTTRTGLVVSHTGGWMSGDGSIKNIAAGTVTVPASSTWSVYLDFTDGTIQSATTIGTPTSNILVIWDGVSDGSSITSFRDVRSWTSTGISTEVTGSFAVQLAALNPDVWFAMDEEITPVVDSIGGITGADNTTLNSYNLPMWTYAQRSPAFDETGNGFELNSVPISTSTTGTVLALVQTASTSERSILEFTDESAVAGQVASWALMMASTGRLQVRVRTNNVTDQINYYSTNVINDGYPHLVMVTQDGAGVKIFIDGVQETLSSTTIAGTATLADWINTVPGKTAAGTGIGVRQLNAGNEDQGWSGYISNVAMWDGVVLTGGNATNLYESLTGDFWSYIGDLGAEYRYFLGDDSLRLPNIGIAGVGDGGMTLGTKFTFDYQQEGIGGAGSTGAMYSIGNGHMRSAGDEHPGETGRNSTYGTLIQCIRFPGWQDGTDIFDASIQGGSSPDASMGFSMNSSGQLVWNSKKAASADNDTRTYTTTSVDDSVFHCLIAAKSNDANPPAVYLDGVLLDTFTDEDSNSSLQEWWDEAQNIGKTCIGFVEGTKVMSKGSMIEHFICIEDVVINATQAAEINALYRTDEAAHSFQGVIMGAGPSHFWPLTEANVPLVDKGFATWQNNTNTSKVKVDLTLKDGTDSASILFNQPGPVAGVNAITFPGGAVGSARIRQTVSGWQTSFDSKVAYMCFFTSNVDAVNHRYLMHLGNTGGAYEVTCRLQTNNDFYITIRHSTNNMLWQLTSGVAFDDGNWHMIAHIMNGTTWRIFIDGTWYGTADIGGAIAQTFGGTGVDQTSTWDVLPLLDAVTIGNRSVTTANVTQTWNGSIAMPTIWRGNLEVPTEQAIEAIWTASGL